LETRQRKANKANGEKMEEKHEPNKRYRRRKEALDKKKRYLVCLYDTKEKCIEFHCIQFKNREEQDENKSRT